VRRRRSKPADCPPVARTIGWLATTVAVRRRSSTPLRWRNRTSAERVAEIMRLRRQRLSGPNIAGGLGMPISTAGKVLRRFGLGQLAALAPGLPVVRCQGERPGELLHIDVKKRGRIETVGHRITSDPRDKRRGAGRECWGGRPPTASHVPGCDG
jgi:hypothetical protein